MEWFPTRDEDLLSNHIRGFEQKIKIQAQVVNITKNILKLLM